MKDLKPGLKVLETEQSFSSFTTTEYVPTDNPDLMFFHQFVVHFHYSDLTTVYE